MAEHAPVPASPFCDETVDLRDLDHEQSFLGKQFADMTEYAIHLINVFQHIPHRDNVNGTVFGLILKEVYTFQRQAKVFLCIGELVL